MALPFKSWTGPVYDDFRSTGTCDVMVFRPTMEEFRDFFTYMKFIEYHGAHRKCGIAKIIPPPEWTPRPIRGKNYEEVSDMVIESPVQQKVQGEKGCYTQFNMVFKKKMTVRDYKTMADSQEYKPPLFEDYDDMERKYWKNIHFRSAIYGADFHGTLYDNDAVDVWNINSLPSILDLLKEIKEAPLEGVNNAYMYFGMYKATFPWHTEDMDLYSINYIHFGAPKFWYGISDEYKEKFEQLAKSLFPQSAKQCRNFLRHKMYLISPTVLKQNNIPYGTMLHNEGEFMITFAGGYHAGFNCGYNAAESTNFALERWIDFGKVATYCECEEDTVRIDMEPFLRKFRSEDEVLSYMKRFNVPVQSSGSKACIPKKREATQEKEEKKVKRRKKIKEEEEEKMSSGGGGLVEKMGQRIEDVKMTDTWYSDEASTSSGVSLSEEEEHEDVQERPFSSTSFSSTDSLHRRAKPDIGDLFSEEHRLFRMWRWKMYDFEAEKQWNEEEALWEPHCAICQCFIPKSLARKAKEIPKKSRKLVSELCYSRNPDRVLILHPPAKREFEHQKDEDYLLTCEHCQVTVHAKCYGVREVCEDRTKWRCTRCTEAAQPTMVDCRFCNLRGGAMLPVEKEKDQDEQTFAHIICTLYHPGARFSDPVQGLMKPILVEKDTPTEDEVEPLYKCDICHGDSGFTVGCSHHECEPAVYMHVTCARAIEASFEFRDFPLLVALICPKHDQVGADGLGPIETGETVICWMEEGTKVTKGVVSSKREEIFAVVDFDDGSFSSNLYLEDVKECSCDGCEGAHVSGSRVKVLWSDKEGQKEYRGHFRRAYIAKTYTVKLQGGNLADCRREELYGPKELVPESVLERLAKNNSTS